MGVEGTYVGKQLPLHIVDLYRGWELIGIEHIRFILEPLVHVQVVEGEVAMAFITVWHVGGHHVGISRMQRHYDVGQMELSLAFCHEKQAREGGRHILPIQSAWWRANPIKHDKVERLDGHVHSDGIFYLAISTTNVRIIIEEQKV